MSHRTIRPELTDKFRDLNAKELLEVFDEKYFCGSDHGDIWGYDDYAKCKSILHRWSFIVNTLVRPTSVLDIGAAYGFVVESFQFNGTFAEGIEPSDYAREKANVELHYGYLPELMPNLIGPEPDGKYHTVLCTEVLEHILIDEPYEEDAINSLIRVANYASKYVICLIMTGEDDVYHEDPTHIHLRTREWWDRRFEEFCMFFPEFEVDHELVEKLDKNPYCQKMDWSGRFFVLNKNN